MGSVPSAFEAVDDAIRASAEGAFSFLERLIGARSTVGEEAPAQRIVADELARLGFDIAAVPVPPGTAAQPGAGVPQAPYTGRANVLGRLGGGRVAVTPAERPRGRGAGRRGGVAG
jgi:acetylornithine deacetylase/succinyl-diaminopimelate desuccinylase-like protein